MRRSLTWNLTWVMRSTPMPKAKPVYTSGSMPKLRSMLGCTMPQPSISTQPVCLQRLHPLPPHTVQDIIKLYFRGTATDPAARHKARLASNNWRWQQLSKFPKPTIAMVNGFCFGGAFTQVSACDFAIAADEATFGLSEVNWGILPGGIVAWNVAQIMNYRNAIYYATTGEPFDGKRAVEIGFVNKSVPKSKLKAEVVKLAQLLMKKSPAAMRYTKECVRAVRFMNEPEAADYLNAKSDALKYNDKERGREHGMKQFLDEKTFRPGLGQYDRKKAQKDNAANPAKPQAKM